MPLHPGAAVTAFRVTGKDMRGQGNDRHATVLARQAQLPYLSGRLEAIHQRHRHVHQHEIEAPFCRRRDHRLAVFDDLHRAADLGQQRRDEALVGLVVLGDEDRCEPEPLVTVALRVTRIRRSDDRLMRAAAADPP